jgi:Fe-S-cluster-containing hydrogenase component 2
MHILLEGFVKVARRTTVGTGRDKTDERIIAYRQGGDYFAGGLDLLGDGRAVSVTAITRARVAEVAQETLLRLFARYPEVKERFTFRLQQYRDAAAAAQTGIFDPLAHTRTEAINPRSDAEARAGLRSLVGGGVIEGTEVLVIDLDKCIHCNECEEACARRHGHSRMNRKGMVVGNISIATACRQCQDPVCMLCSRAGIARLPSGEVYITDSCIGCGICAERCPYDNISIMTLDEEGGGAKSSSYNTWQQFSSFFARGAGKERGRKSLPMLQAAPGPLDIHQARDAYGEMRKKLAIKCDLCAGYDNQACVQACPTGAAMRIQPSTFFGSTEDILSKRTR